LARTTGLTDDQRVRFRATRVLGAALLANLGAHACAARTFEDIESPGVALASLVLLVPGLSLAAVLLFGVVTSPPKDMLLLAEDDPLRVLERDPMHRWAKRWLLGSKPLPRLLLTVAPTYIGVLLLAAAYL
jgi:hypothetical protein